MDCPKGLPPGQCCGITKAGSTYVQKVLACQRDVLGKRVEISKSGPIVLAKEGNVVDEQRMNVRKVAWELITKTAERLREESRVPLTREQSIAKTVDRYPNLAALYDAGVRQGDPHEATEAAPVTKAAPISKAQALATIEARAREVATTRGITREQAVVEVLRAQPALYTAYVNGAP